MGVLKKGSKGKEVEAAQKLLNKAGAKPKLAEDGLFGPLTDKQTRDFQKKSKTKVDGKIGDNTAAALKFGRALPVLPEIATDDRVVRDTGYGSSAAKMAKAVAEAEKEFSALVKTGVKNFAIVQKIQAEDVAVANQRVAIAKQISALKQDFEKNLKNNPAKSEKLLAEFDKLADKWYGLYLGGSDTNWRPYLDAISKDMARCLRLIEKI